MRARPDILVIGLGPAGSCAAHAAAEAGCSVLAVDRRARPGLPVQCAEFVPAMLGLEGYRLDPVARQRIEAMVTQVERERPDLKEQFPGYIIDRAAFDAALVERARAAGADCRLSAPVEAIARDGAVAIKGIGVVRPRAVVGADGPRSWAGRAIGHPNIDFVETRQITVRLLVPHAATDIFLAAEIEGGYGWLFPKADVANLGVGVVPSAKARLKPLLDQLHAALVRDGRVGPEILGHTGGPIPVGSMLDPVGRLGPKEEPVPVLLAGDAAGLANPVTGAGISAAVISGSMAGQALAGWCGGDADALAGYAEELADIFKPALDRALERRRELLARYGAEGGPSPAALRRGWIAYPEYWAA